MKTRISLLICIALAMLCVAVSAQEKEEPSKVYVPYEKLKDVFEREGNGVFLPYSEFMKLWREAQGKPATIAEAPVPYMISTARFSGTVEEKLARLSLNLTFDVLKDDWQSIPLMLSGVAVESAEFTKAPVDGATPLLQLRKGLYHVLVKGQGRWELKLDFVRQIDSTPGKNVLSFTTPRAAVSTLELVIPEENMGVKVEPMLAATTVQIPAGDTKHTKLQAFLGNAAKVSLTWKPTSESDSKLEPIIIGSQIQHLRVSEALIEYDLVLNYEIHRNGVKAFTVNLPSGFRVTTVTGADLANWDVKRADGRQPQLLVNLFSMAKGSYQLRVKLERFMKGESAELKLEPTWTEGVLRRTGLLAVTHVKSRSIEVDAPRQDGGLVRVDVNKLPQSLRRNGAIAYSFSSEKYGYGIKVGTVYPRIELGQDLRVEIEKALTRLTCTQTYSVSRAGIFSVDFFLPKTWQIDEIGPASLVDDYEVQEDGELKHVTVTFARELTGAFQIVVRAHQARGETDDVQLQIPYSGSEHISKFSGRLDLFIDPALSAEVKKLNGLENASLTRQRITSMASVFSFQYRGLKGIKTITGEFGVTAKPAQISATTHRLVDIQQGSIQHEVFIDFFVLYAPVDTFYIRLPKTLEKENVEITAANLKEKPVVGSPPGEEVEDGFYYHKIVLQAPKTGNVRVTIRWRRPLQIAQDGKNVDIELLPVVAAAIANQKGYIAVAKAESLAIGEPKLTELVLGDPGSAVDLPHQNHRTKATLALKHSAANYALTLPVRYQKEAEVFTTIVNGLIVQQVLGRDGTLNAKATYLISTSRGDRLPLKLAGAAEFYSFHVNGKEVPVEATDDGSRVVRLPRSSGNVDRLTLEVIYKLEDARPSELVAPMLPSDVPIQRTYWILHIPKDHYLLGHDRVFAKVRNYGVGSLVGMIGNGHRTYGGARFPTQGRAIMFARPGGSYVFSARVVRRETYAILVWLVVLAAGIVMLRYNSFQRTVVVAGVAAIGATWGLFAPLAAKQAAILSIWPFLLVLLLWFGQCFRAWRKRRGELHLAMLQAAATSKESIADEEEDDGEEKPKKRRRRRPSQKDGEA